MADVVPVKAIRTGADVTALGEMISTDTIAATRVNINGATEIGADLVDSDEIPVYDASATANRKSLLSRIWTYISGKLTATANTFTANQIISVADNTNAALRITQTGTGNALLVEDEASDGSPFVIAADGRCFVGHTAAITGVFNSSILQLQSLGGNNPVAIFRYANDEFSSDIEFCRSRNATTGSHTVLQDGDRICTMRFAGSDGSAFKIAAQVRIDVDGAPSSNDMPGRIMFYTTADGSSTPTERLRINSSGNVLIATGTDDTSGAKLQVAGAITVGDGSASLPSLSNRDDFNTGIYFPAADTVAIATGGTQRLLIDTSGNVENPTAGEGVILKSPDGTRYKLTVANGGILTVTAA